MLNDKEFQAFQEGIFKDYFEKYILFKRGKGEKVTHSTLIRLKSLNQELTLACDSLEISHEAAEFILREREKESPSTRGDFVFQISVSSRLFFEVWGSFPMKYHTNI